MLTRIIDLYLKRSSTYGGYHPSKDPPIWLTNKGFFARSGVVVNEDNAKQLSAFYRGISLYCSTFAALPLFVHKRRDDGGKDRAASHWLFKILHTRPNRFMTPAELKEMLMGHLLLRGNFYAWKVFNNAGRVVELWPIHPDKVTPTWEKTGGTWGITYDVHDAGDANGKYLSDKILHIKGAGSDGVKGESILDVGRETIGRGLAAGEHASDFFKNYAVPMGVLEYPEELDEDEYKRLKDSWKEKQGGESRYSPAILENGMKWQQLGLTNEAAEFLGSRKFEVTEIARLLGLPPHKIGDMEHSTFSNIEHQQMEFKQDSILPWAVRIEESLSLGLLSDKEQDLYFVEFLMDGLLRGDQLARHNAHHLALQDGWMTRNEVRIIENLNPDPTLDGFLEPLNMVPAGTPRDPAKPQAPAVPASAPAPKKKSLDISALGPIFDSVADRALTKEQKRLHAAAGRSDAGKYLEEFYDGHAEYLTQVFAPLVTATRTDVLILNRWADAYVTRRQGELVQCLACAEWSAKLEDHSRTITIGAELFDLLKGDGDA